MYWKKRGGSLILNLQGISSKFIKFSVDFTKAHKYHCVCVFVQIFFFSKNKSANFSGTFCKRFFLICVLSPQWKCTVEVRFISPFVCFSWTNCPISTDFSFDLMAIEGKRPDFMLLKEAGTSAIWVDPG